MVFAGAPRIHDPMSETSLDGETRLHEFLEIPLSRHSVDVSLALITTISRPMR